MTRLSVSDIAEKHLVKWWEALISGELELWGLPPSVAAFYHAGFADGLDSRQPEIDRLEHQLDTYWALAYLTKDERKERILQRLDNGLAIACDASCTQLEHDLAAMAGRQTGIEAANTAAVGSPNDGSSNGTTGVRRKAA